MDRTNTGLEMLMHTIAMLLSLANVADQAAGRSRRYRRRLLAAMRPAEILAWDMLVSEARRHGAPEPVLETFLYAHAGDDHNAALCLAANLRTMALALMRLAQTCCRTGEPYRTQVADKPANAMRTLLAAASAIAKPALPRSCFDTC